MVITKAVKLHLKADMGVTSIVDGRVHLRRAPQRSEFPHVIVSVAGAEWPTRSQESRNAGTTHVIKARVQVDCYSTDENQVDDLAESVAAAFDDFKGPMQGILVKRSLQDDERDNYETLLDASDVGVHRITQIYGVHYLEPT
jgi:hypothetical protein